LVSSTVIVLTIGTIHGRRDKQRRKDKKRNRDLEEWINWRIAEAV